MILRDYPAVVEIHGAKEPLKLSTKKLGITFIFSYDSDILGNLLMLDTTVTLRCRCSPIIDICMKGKALARLNDKGTGFAASI